ncbi:hypothetical protein Psi01_10750 [Planobispora siamensis]|uniref:Uncharacterized protein n=1 Tax=Planobispora siamensis TaxID=936338 RepID=A0A8J3SDB4_9ACTN|nr:hypothetical protein Psi01_10750 [Planobispora siamensis]
MLMVVAALVLAGCAQAGGDSSATGLAGAMAEVAESGPASQAFLYNDLAHWRDLGLTPGEEAEGPWLEVAAFSLGAFGVPERRDPVGGDLSGADRAISIGIPPDTVRLDGGFDAAAVRDGLVAAGGAPRRLGEHEVITRVEDVTATSENGLLVQTSIDDPFGNVVVTGSVIAASPFASSVRDVLGGSPTMAGKDGYLALAACLGDVAAAFIVDPQEVGSGPGVRLQGVGLRRPASVTDRPVSVVCVLPEAAEHAAVRGDFTTRFTPRGKNHLGKPFGDHAEEIVHDEVEFEDLTVLRATVRHTAATSASVFLRTLAPEDYRVVGPS